MTMTIYSVSQNIKFIIRCLRRDTFLRLPGTMSGVTFILIFSREYLSCITLCWSQADIMSGYFLS